MTLKLYAQNIFVYVFNFMFNGELIYFSNVFSEQDVLVLVISISLWPVSVRCAKLQSNEVSFSNVRCIKEAILDSTAQVLIFLEYVLDPLNNFVVDIIVAVFRAQEAVGITFL